MKHITILGLVLASVIVTSCQSLSSTPENNKKAVCKELNRQIVLNGATPDQRQADIQSAEKSSLIANYDKEGC